MVQTNQIDWTVRDSARLYHVERWGQNFFAINHAGDVVVQPDPSNPRHWNLRGIVEQCQDLGCAPPVLLRFPGIIRQRVKQLNEAFQSAIANFEFQGRYQCVYPIKVNQHHEVIRAVIEASQPYGAGLEAGSKAELMAVIAMADESTKVLCNGFKDESTIAMAMAAKLIGKNISIIVEKPQEIALIAAAAAQQDVKPELGIRVKLAARGYGRWQDSGGERSKFGLTASELSAAIEQLRSERLLEYVTLLHFHPGSQINNVRHIKAALVEVTRIYVDLIRQGLPIQTIDVGGGLAVDYTGFQNTEPSSMNYSLQEYANDVVYYIQMVCDQADVPHPNIVSESGRALVAHHSVLVVPIIGTSADRANGLASTPPVIDPEVQPLCDLKDIDAEIGPNNLLESYHDSQQAMDLVLHLFSNGQLTLQQRAMAESLYWSVCQKIRGFLDELDFVPRELQELQVLFADTYFGNFSVFQSLPDHWAMGHLFPIMPIHRLDERPSRHGNLGDITCDSDGQIACFIGDEGERRSLPLHAVNPDQDYYVGIFLVGAYQEALSDDHNLLGKFHVVTVDHSPTGELTSMAGSTLKDVLEHVHHDLGELTQSIQASAENSVHRGLLDESQADSIVAFFRELAGQYSYLTSRADVMPPANPPHRAPASSQLKTSSST